MPRSLTAQDRSSLIRLASALPKGSPERKAILAGLSKVSAESFEEAVRGKKFKNPETGNDVSFGSLPKEEQAKLRAKFDKKKPSKSPEEVDSSYKNFLSSGPGVGYSLNKKQESDIKKMVSQGADLDMITEAIEDGDGELPPKASAKTKKLFDYLNKIFAD